jgi:hypothetical protein
LRDRSSHLLKRDRAGPVELSDGDASIATAAAAALPKHVFAGIKKVDDGIRLVSFMHYDLGYFDLEQKTLQPLDNPFGTRLSPMS